MQPTAQGVLVALQCFVLLFEALHNWIPLGTLNDVKGAHAAFPGKKLLFTTLSNVIPFSVGLIDCILYFGRMYPDWLFYYLWISYALAVIFSMRAWWIPYFVPNPELAARYKVMYASMHSILPERNGIKISTLHVIFDAAVLAILITLAVVTMRQNWRPF